MSEKERSQQRASLFAEVISAVVNPVIEDEHVAHDWAFYNSDDWEQSSGSRGLIEEFASTLSDASSAVYAIQKPHKYLEEIAEWIERMDTVAFEKRAMIDKFGFWQCQQCSRQSTYRPEDDEESCY
jgi:hypothetical protein